ncbi:MAG: FKBP-type peptidyl-prolyl cis-trans isomerase [Actinomycetota bacterium]|nr:FKBP-type peptidyl-prolyl cis-trans isomerase [Actinomycetota bacterium]
MSEKNSPDRRRLAHLAVLFALVLIAPACGGGANGELVCERDGLLLDEGMKITDRRCGSGMPAARGMTATVRYEATLPEGEPIRTGAGADETFTFRLGAGQVVPAWDVGLLGMGVGGIRELHAPSELAYGEAGLFPDVLPNASVIFEVELLELSEPEES